MYRLDTEIELLGINDELVIKYNSIDRNLIQSIKSAARKAVEQEQHGHAQSPVLTQAGATVLFWKPVLTSKLHYILTTKKSS